MNYVRFPKLWDFKIPVDSVAFEIFGIRSSVVWNNYFFWIYYGCFWE